MKKILFYIGFVFSFCFPLKILELFSAVKRKLYTGYFSRKFKNFDLTSTIFYPSYFIGQEFISIGHNVKIGRKSVITAWKSLNSNPIISIGDYVDLGEDCHITAANKIIIGNHVLLGKKVTITDNAHGSCSSLSELHYSPLSRKIYSKGPVIIGENVWIGDKSTILPNVNIGKGAIIGANSVVTRDVAAYSVVAGVPAKEVKSFC